MCKFQQLSECQRGRVVTVHLEDIIQNMGSSVAEWLACWTQEQKGLGSSRSRDSVG